VAIGHRQVHPDKGQKAFRPGLDLHLRPAEELPIQVMHDHRRPGAAGPEIIAGYMIGVAVGVDYKAQPPAFLVKTCRQAGGRPSRVHQEGLTANGAGHEIGEDL
jgi:hypothetical protein